MSHLTKVKIYPGLFVCLLCMCVCLCVCVCEYLCVCVCAYKGKMLVYDIIQGVSKKRNLFDLEYPQDGLFKLIVLLGGYLVLPYNSMKLNFGFLR